MSNPAAQRVASKLCGAYPNVCDTHIEEALEVIRLVPELLTDPEVITEAARAWVPDLDQKHPADQTLAKSLALTFLTGAARKLTEGLVP